MTLTYTLDKPELTRAMHHHFKHRGKVWSIMWPIIASLMLYYGLSIMVSTGSYLFGTIICLCSLVFFWRKQIAIWRSVRRAFAGKPDAQQILIEISKQQLRMTTPKGRSTASWGNFIDAHRTPDGILLYTNKNVFNWIPESPVTGGTWEEFCGHIQRLVQEAA